MSRRGKFHTSVCMGRTFNASVAEVWRVWNDADSIKSGGGPNSHRDAVLNSGIEKGVAASYDRLREFLMSLPARGMEKGAGKSCAQQA